jgi:hypothetical protein
VSFAVDVPADGKWVMYVDKNNNEDLSDDGPPLGHRTGSGTNTDLVSLLDIDVPVVSSRSETLSRPYRLWVSVSTSKGYPRLRYYSICHHEGTIRIGDREFGVLVNEYDTYDALYPEISINLNDDKEFAPGEQFSDGSIITVDGRRYILKLEYP